MAFYSDELIEEVRSANNIVDVIGEYVSLKKKGSSYFGLCPFHNEKTGSFSVSESKQMYYCFGCGAGGNVFTFLMNYENFSFKEAMEALADRAGIALPEQEMSKEERARADKKSRLLELNKEAATYFYTQLRREQGKSGMEYFIKRGLSQETMKKFGLGYSNKYSDDLYQYLVKKGTGTDLLKDSGLVTLDEKRGGYDKFWNRVMFPIMDVHNHVVGFGGRVLGDGEPKYLNSPETPVFDKSRNLYGLNIARTSRKPYLLLCEGYMDVISLHQAGFDMAVAALGTAFTQGHAFLMKRYAKEVYLTFDSDNAGVKAALRAIPILREVGLPARVINMNPYKDPDEFIKNLGAEEYQKRIDEAENSFLFEIRMLQKEYNMGDPQGKTAFQEQVARKLITTFHEELERNNYIEAISQTFHIKQDGLMKLVASISSKMDGQVVKKKPLKSGINSDKLKEDGNKKAQKLLITSLIEHPEIFDTVKQFVEPLDFTEELYYQVATIVYDGLEHGSLNPPQIISRFELEEEQREVASLFNATIHNIETAAEQEQAIKDVIAKVKQNSIDDKTEKMDPQDMQLLMKLIDEKRKLEKIEKIEIHLNNDQN
ncbi:MAG: DNA primase [Lachnospiraceae bacterium]|nr:DNA primase [Lachnospiraceae bacterium]